MYNSVKVARQRKTEEKLDKQAIVNIVREAEIDSEYELKIIKARLDFKANLHGKCYASKEKRRKALLGTSECVVEAFNDLIVGLRLLKNGIGGIQEVVSFAVPKLEELYGDVFDAVKTASEMLVTLAEHNVCDLDIQGEIKVTNKVPLSADIQEKVDRAIYLPPMVCRPLVITKNNGSGYLTRKESVILGGEYNYTSKPISLDVLNILNSIPMSLEHRLINEVEKPSDKLIKKEQFDKFNDFVSQSKEVYEYLMNEGNEFYFCHKFDKRGRVYSQGYHIHIQGGKHKQSLLMFAEKELIEL